MSAVMSPRRARRRRQRPAAAGQQPALFGAGASPAAAAPAPAAAAAPAVPAVPAVSAAPTAEPSTTARAHRHGPTLDDLVAGAWEGLLAGAPAGCVACGAPMAPRHSAGAGVVGGCCGSCGTTVS